MQSLFNPEAYKEIKDRLNSLTPEAEKKWGKMTVSQMLHHCQKPILIALERETISKPPFLIRFAMKLMKPMLYNDKPWKKGLPTAKELEVTQPKDFSNEKQQLDLLIEDFHGHSNKEEWRPHPVFGTFTKEQWGKMQYKHLDHHLTQFNV